MLIKSSKKGEFSAECPEEKLKSISCTQELVRHRPSYPVTPDRSKKQVWIMDPWQNTIDQSLKTPDEDRILHKHIDNHSTSKYRQKKGEHSKDRYDENNIYSTPQTVKNEGGEKENKYRFRLYSQARAQKAARVEEVEESGIFKKPISSILYPVVKDSTKQKNRRIDRFHSFVARNIRK